MKKIALFGGNFNPVHNGHIRIAKVAADTVGLDRVIFVPAHIQPFKQDQKSESGETRLDMLRLATAGDARFEVSDFEVKSGGISYSYITAEHYKSVYPDDILYFIAGDDAYAEIDKWMKADRLRACVEFIVFPRQGNIKVSDAIFIDTEPLKVSSTEIRRRIRLGTEISDMVPLAVFEYIKKNKLYK